jgi:DUF2911 family protein
MSRSLLLAFACLVALTTSAFAQGLKAPEASPAATVMQQIGLTDLTISYHRPATNNRPIWGQLVPYNDVWRAGANENTTFTSTSDVKINGKLLRAGTYGIHMIPTQKDWTVIFSNMSVAWGSFTYDQKEDALRITATPRALANSVERLLYTFDDPTETKTTLVMSWEKVAVPVTIEIETPKVVMDSMRRELRGTANFRPEPWNQAARYWATNGGSLDEAMKMVDKSITMRSMYGNHMTRALILEKQGKAAAAAEEKAKALPLANEGELNQAAYALINEKKLDDALALFRKITEKFPESWNAHDSLGEGLALKGDKAGAIAEYEKALSMAKDPVQKKRIEGVLQRLKK